MKSEVVRKWFIVAVSTVTFAGMLYYCIFNASLFRHHLELVSNNLLLTFLVVLILLVSYDVNCLINKLIFDKLKLQLSHYLNFQLSIITGFYNLITPFKGGMAVRAVYLKKHYNFSYTDFLATTAATYILTFLVAGISGLTATFIIYEQSHTYSWILGLIFGATVVGMVALMFFPKLKEPKHRWLSKFVRVINGWHIIKRHPKVIAKITGLSILQLFLGAFMLLLQFKVFGVGIDFASALFLASIGSLSILIAVTPAGLGINEAVTVFSALTIGITVEQSLAAAILGRLVSVVVLFTLGPWFSWRLLKK